MILYQDNFLNQSEINHLLGLWDNNKPVHPIMKYNLTFYYLNFMTNDLDLTPIKDGIFERRKFHKMRLQKYNESINQTEYFHGHLTTHNYIIYLNEEFKGGELEFENGLLVKPKTGSLVYFNNNEKHRVKDCIGDRYIFTALGDIQVDIKWQMRNKNTI